MNCGISTTLHPCHIPICPACLISSKSDSAINSPSATNSAKATLVPYITASCPPLASTFCIISNIAPLSKAPAVLVKAPFLSYACSTPLTIISAILASKDKANLSII